MGEEAPDSKLTRKLLSLRPHAALELAVSGGLRPAGAQSFGTATEDVARLILRMGLDDPSSACVPAAVGASRWRTVSTPRHQTQINTPLVDDRRHVVTCSFNTARAPRPAPFRSSSTRRRQPAPSFASAFAKPPVLACRWSPEAAAPSCWACRRARRFSPDPERGGRLWCRIVPRDDDGQGRESPPFSGPRPSRVQLRDVREDCFSNKASAGASLAACRCTRSDARRSARSTRCNDVALFQCWRCGTLTAQCRTALARAAPSFSTPPASSCVAPRRRRGQERRWRHGGLGFEPGAAGCSANLASSRFFRLRPAAVSSRSRSRWLAALPTSAVVPGPTAFSRTCGAAETRARSRCTGGAWGPSRCRAHARGCGPRRTFR